MQGSDYVAVRDFNLDIEAGEFFCLLGTSGCGKTTVLNMLSGFYRPDAGSIRIANAQLQGMPAWRIARAGIVRTYQTTQLFGSMSVAENLAIAGGAESLAAFVGYAGDLDARAADLPHVDKRLVEIARALAMKPSVLLLDEPAPKIRSSALVVVAEPLLMAFVVPMLTALASSGAVRSSPEYSWMNSFPNEVMEDSNLAVTVLAPPAMFLA